MTRARLDRAALVGLALAAVSFVVYALSNRYFDAYHADFFYLAEAFLHGRVWLEPEVITRGTIAATDTIAIGDRIYVPFGPFPAIAFMPLVAFVGPVTAELLESRINAALAATVLGLGWWLLARLEVRSLVDRFWLVLLLGFSTQLWWVTTRGGVWHTGHLIATILTLACLIELEGRKRAWLIGLMAGAAFLSRAPVAFAIPFYALLVAGDRIWEPRRWPWASWLQLAAGVVPSIAFFLWYNAARFGSPFESGYALAVLPAFLEVQRQQGLFSIVHLPMNLDYLFLHLPAPWRSLDALEPPFFKPDGLGMSILLTSPGLLLAAKAPWRTSRAWWLTGAALLVLVPSLLYYGGGWLQYGYRYALDSIPFVWALCGLATAAEARRRAEAGIEGPALEWGWRLLIVAGVVVGLGGVYWAYHL